MTTLSTTAQNPLARALHRSGLLAGDKIVEFDGQLFPDVTALRLYIFNLPIGKQVPVVVRRGREKIELTMEVGAKRNYNSEFSM